MTGQASPRPALRLRRRARGIALPVVLLIAALMLAGSVAWFEAALLGGRGAAAFEDALRAFHAADAALATCERAVAAQAPQPAPVAGSGVMDGWRQQAVFEAQAFAPFAQWPGSVRPPQCLVERMRLAGRPSVRAFLVTARGFGRSREAQAWLQSELAVEDGRVIERRWRRVAARPF